MLATSSGTVRLAAVEADEQPARRTAITSPRAKRADFPTCSSLLGRLEANMEGL